MLLDSKDGVEGDDEGGDGLDDDESSKSKDGRRGECTIPCEDDDTSTGSGEGTTVCAE